MSNFEDQIKKQGDTFSIEPGEKVWLRVEAELDKNRKRRPAAWWWMAPLFLFIGSGIYYVALQKETKQPATTRQTAQRTATETDQQKTLENTTPTTTQANKNTIEPQKPAQAVAGIEKATSEKSIAGNADLQKAYPLAPGKGTLKNTPSQPYPHITATTVPEETPPVTLGAVDATPSQPAKQQEHPANMEKSPVDRIDAISTEPGVQTQAGKKLQAIKEEADEEVQLGAQQETTIAPTVKTGKMADPGTVDSVAAGRQMPVIANTNKKLVNWKLILSAGIANNTTDNFQLFSNGEKMYADPLNNSGGGSSAMAALPTDPNKPGVSLGVAIQRRQNLNRRLEWHARLGLQYRQIIQSTGFRKDSTINQSASNVYNASFYYTGGSMVSHKGYNLRTVLTNDIAFSVLKNKRSLLLTGGFYTGFNLSNNYLVPDYNSRRYIKVNSLYKTWFAGVDLGVEYNFKNGFNIGLETMHDLTRSFITLGGKNHYWNSLQLNVGIPLKTK